MQEAITDFTCAGLIILDTTQTVYVAEGQTVSGAHATGYQRLFEVTDRSSIAVRLASTRWDTGEQDIRGLAVHGPQTLRRLEQGVLRVSIRSITSKAASVELRQARVNLQTQNRWSNVYNATQAELDEGAGLDVFHTLRRAGATKLGTKAALLDCRDNTRRRLCVIFPKTNLMVPVVAFVLTRILPLKYEYTV